MAKQATNYDFDANHRFLDLTLPIQFRYVQNAEHCVEGQLQADGHPGPQLRICIPA